MRDEEPRLLQSLVHDARGIERMELLATVLQNEDFRLIGDARNARAKALFLRAEATKAAARFGKWRR